jgi:hypothetical protein
MVSMTIRRLQYTDRSVRDMPQRVIIMSDVITVQSLVGRVKVSEYNIMRRDWGKLQSSPTCNPNWNKAEFIREHTRHYDSEHGGSCQAERIRDSQRMAIDTGLLMWKEQHR